MRFELTGRHLDITTAHRRTVASKLKPLARLMDDVTVSAQVVLSVAKPGCRAEVSLHARDEKFLHSAGEAATFPQAMSMAVDKLVSQGKSVKGKWQTRKRRPARAGKRTIGPDASRSGEE